MASSSRDKAVMLTKDSVSLLPCFYFVELPILVSCVVVLYFLEWTDVFSPVRAGFSCHDRSLSLPYVDPHHEVIPLMMLLSLAFAGPAITIMIGEAILFCCLSRRKTGPGTEANINAAGCNFNSFIRRAVRFVGVHAFGLCATALITDVLQLMTGYPAPYFLTVCKPDYGTRNVTCEQSPYVLDDICAGPDPAAINQGRKSFPSQHATLASFAAVYVSMYFNSTLTDSSKLLKPLLVFSFVICAIICGLTRIIQYKNHAMDVYLGFVLGGAIAVYLGLYAVGNFQPSEEGATGVPPPPRGVHCPPCSLPHISQEAVLHHLQMKAMAGNHHHHQQGLPASYSDGLLHRALQQQQQLASGCGADTLKRSSADVDVMSPRSPLGKDPMVTFSHTLPRVHTPQAMAAYEEAARRHAATLHHGSMDSSRSKQLLSQWKKSSSQDQGHRKCSLQVPDSFSSSVDSSSGQSSQHPHHHGSMELLRVASEPPPSSSCAVGLLQNGGGGFDSGAQSYMAKLAAGASTTLPGNCSSSGIAGGGRVMQAAMMMQSRPGSSQLVHIPEEAHENFNHHHHHQHHYAAGSSPRTTGVGGGGEAAMAANSAAAAAAAQAQANWQRAAEATAAAYRTSDGQPRIMQVIAMSKQQGLLQTHSKSLDEGSMGGGCGGGGGCGAAAPRYRGLADHQEPPSPLGGDSSAVMMDSISGSTGAIVRVEAHPENNNNHHHRPVIQPPSAQDGGSWRWRSLDHGTGGGGGGVKQSFELNDLNRDSESSESTRDGSVDRNRANRVANNATAASSPTVTVHTQNTGHGELRPPPSQGLSTIRVTPGDGGTGGVSGPSPVSVPGGGAAAAAEGGSEVPSSASSRESTLRRKANNIILIPERANSPDSTRNIFYKGTSMTHTFKE